MGIPRHMKKLPVLLVAVLSLPACYEEGVAELGVYNGAQGSPADGPPTLGDSSLPIPIDLGDSSLPIPVDPPAPDTQCHRFVAHAASDANAPYAVAAGAQQNVRFTFRAPWQGTTFIRSIKPIVDNPKVLHNWQLYADTYPAQEGVVIDDGQSQYPGSLVYGWTPGSTPLQLGSNMGIPVQDDVSYTLRTRYSNLNGGAGLDASGIEVCVSSQPVIFGVSLTLREGL